MALLEEFQFEVASEAEWEGFYLDLVIVHGKLGYLFESSGEERRGQYHYEAAMNYASRVNPDYGNKNHVNSLIRRSSIGCRLQS